MRMIFLNSSRILLKELLRVSPVVVIMSPVLMPPVLMFPALMPRS
jgi:hypothetical protein